MICTARWMLCIAMALSMAAVRAQDQKEQDNAKPELQKVGNETELLLRKINNVGNVTEGQKDEPQPIATFIRFFKQAFNIDIAISKSAGQKQVTLKLQAATLGEYLRQLEDQAGATHRVVEGRLLIALPDEWAAIDAGKAQFEEAIRNNRAVKKVGGEFSVSEDRKTVTVNGKEYTMEEFMEKEPRMYEIYTITEKVINATERKSTATEKEGNATERISTATEKEGNATERKSNATEKEGNATEK